MTSQYFNQDYQLSRQSVRQFIKKEVIPNAEKWDSSRLGGFGYLKYYPICRIAVMPVWAQLRVEY